MSETRSSAAEPASATPHAAEPSAGPDFALAALRHRRDGWTPQRQHDFIRALAASGCMTEACAAVGLSPSSAYRLRALPAATAFRQAWDLALDCAIRRVADSAFSRALHGVARPMFFKGEQMGERRYFDEKLTMFLLRTRDPVRYGRWLDTYEARRPPDAAGIVLAHALNAVTDAAYGVELEPAEVENVEWDDLEPDVGEADEGADDAWMPMPAALDRGPPPPRDPPPSPGEEEESCPMISAIKRRYAEIEARERANEARDAEGGDAEHARLAKPDWNSPMAVHRFGRKRARRRRRGKGLRLDVS